jgi:hypothetical protein
VLGWYSKLHKTMSVRVHTCDFPKEAKNQFSYIATALDFFWKQSSNCPQATGFHAFTSVGRLFAFKNNCWVGFFFEFLWTTKVVSISKLKKNWVQVGY